MSALAHLRGTLVRTGILMALVGLLGSEPCLDSFEVFLLFGRL